MPLIGDRALASRPEQFELVKSPRGAKQFRTFAMVTPLLPLAAAVVGYFIDNLILLIVGLAMAVGAPLVMTWFSRNAHAWQMTDGRALSHSVDLLGATEDPDEVRRRIASRDPETYTPVKLAVYRNTESGSLHAFWPENEQVTYVVVMGRQDYSVEPPEIIELHDNDHVVFHDALNKGLNHPFAS